LRKQDRVENDFLADIAIRLYKGQSYKKICLDLGYSIGSIKHFIRYIYKACDVHSKIGLRIYIDAHFPNKRVNEADIKKAVKYYI